MAGAPSLRGRLAQLVEHLVYTERVGGSSPSAPTRFRDIVVPASAASYRTQGRGPSAINPFGKPAVCSFDPSPSVQADVALHERPRYVSGQENAAPRNRIRKR